MMRVTTDLIEVTSIQKAPIAVKGTRSVTGRSEMSSILQAKSEKTEAESRNGKDDSDDEDDGDFEEAGSGDEGDEGEDDGSDDGNADEKSALKKRKMSSPGGSESQSKTPKKEKDNKIKKNRFIDDEAAIIKLLRRFP